MHCAPLTSINHMPFRPFNGKFDKQSWHICTTCRFLLIIVDGNVQFILSVVALMILRQVVLYTFTSRFLLFILIGTTEMCVLHDVVVAVFFFNLLYHLTSGTIHLKSDQSIKIYVSSLPLLLLL